jgi:hypothetical protein
MFKRVFTAFLGTRHEREKKRLMPIVDAIHSHEERLGAVRRRTPRPDGEVHAPCSANRTAALEARIAELKEQKRGRGRRHGARAAGKPS